MNQLVNHCTVLAFHGQNNSKINQVGLLTKPKTHWTSCGWIYHKSYYLLKIHKWSSFIQIKLNVLALLIFLCQSLLSFVFSLVEAILVDFIKVNLYIIFRTSAQVNMISSCFLLCKFMYWIWHLHDLVVPFYAVLHQLILNIFELLLLPLLSLLSSLPWVGPYRWVSWNALEEKSTKE